MAIVTVGIDLAKNVFAVHGVDECGKPTLVRTRGASWQVTGAGGQAAALFDWHGGV